jgi:hypothetical protein
MKPYERRAAGLETYYRLATWNPRSICFYDAPKTYPTEAAARAAARAPGRYRVSEITPAGVTAGAPFEVV